MTRWDDSDGFAVTHVRGFVTDIRGILAGCGCLILVALILLFVVSWTIVKVVPTMALLIVIAVLLAILFLRPRR